MSTYRLRSTAWLGHAKAPKQKQIVSRRSLGTETGNSSSTSLCNFIFAVQSTPTPRIRLSFSCSRRRCFVREQCFRFPKKSALQVAEHKAESECCLCAFLHCVCVAAVACFRRDGGRYSVPSRSMSIRCCRSVRYGKKDSCCHRRQTSPCPAKCQTSLQVAAAFESIEKDKRRTVDLVHPGTSACPKASQI